MIHITYYPSTTSSLSSGHILFEILLHLYSLF